MTLSLRPYQKDDLKILLEHDCAGCFNEQRTGKTPIAIMAMQARHLDKVLIVCPASMMYPWATSWKAWTGNDATICEGNAAKRKRIIDAWEHGPLIISYGSLRDTCRTNGAIEHILNKKPEGCIADEAHRFKDPTTSTARAMYRMCSTIKYRLALTGTPATNKPIDIYGILHWLYPERYSSYWRFAEENFKVYDMYTGFNKSHKEIGDWLPGRQLVIAEELNSFTTQRKRKDVMPWLPLKNYLDIHLKPTRQQRRYIAELEDYFETEDIITQGVLDRLLRVRQVCIAPGILNLIGNSPKLDWVVQYALDYPTKPILIFSKFVSAIDILCDMLKEKRIENKVISGNVSPKLRKEYVDDFQAGKFNVLILQIDAGKEGLTLDRAEDIIFIDQYPPAADIQQAEDRFIATTEDKANKGHTIIRLILDDTYDASLYDLVAARASSIDVINDYIKYLRKED
jgi:SWI/SNF-related matrix-associated actin-dependent regulator 1 of chromatin subfamily A